MTVTVMGSVPFPPGTNAAPLMELAQSFADLAMGLATAATKLTGTADATSQGLTGAAGAAALAHFTDTTATVTGVGSALAQAGKVIQTFATSLTTAEGHYMTAVAAEQVARLGLPWTSGAVVTAMINEGLAVTELEAAGATCASALMLLAAKVGLAELAPIGEMIGGMTGEIVSLVGGLGSAVANATGVLSPDGKGTFAANPLGTIISGSNEVVGAVTWPALPKPTAPAAPATPKPASTTTTSPSTSTTATATPVSTTATSQSASTTTASQSASTTATPKPVSATAGAVADAVPTVSAAKAGAPA